MKLRTPNKTQIITPTSGLMLALEPRFMFDAAGVATGAEVAVQQTAQQQVDQVLPAAQADGAPKADASDHANDTAADRASIEPVEIANTEPVTTLDNTTDLANALSNLQLGSHDRQEIVFVDSRIADYQSLLNGIDARAEVVLLNTQGDGLAQIAQTLSGRQNIDAIHLISHGNSGQISLGSAVLNVDSMNTQYAESLRNLGQHLSSDADILIYGCDFAAGNAGLLAVNRLAELTGADVAASSDDTGSASKGGDWILETNTGNIQAGLALNQAAMDGYAELFAAPTVTDTAPNISLTVGENASNSNVGQNISITGTGSDILSVTASVGKGSLNGTTFSGNAAQVESLIQSLTYSYTGSSQTGDTDTLTLTVTNQTNGGDTTFSRNIAIAPQNDVPTLTPPASGAGRLSITEGGSQHFAAATGVGPNGAPTSQINLGLLDPDNTPTQIIVKLTAQPAKGVLKLNGNEISIGSTFSVNDISNLVYEHNGSQVLATTTDSFNISVDDGAGGLLQNQTVTVDITPVNQGPTASGTITLIEGETNVNLVGGTLPAIGGARGNLAITDPDDATGTHNVTITALPANGTLQYNGSNVSVGQVINNANLALFTYSHNGTETSSDSFKITVSDDGGGTGTSSNSAEQTINLVILSNNDDPVLSTNTGVHFGPDTTTHPDPGQLSGTSVTLTPAMLKVADTESPDNRLTYEITAIPDIGKGYLTYASTGLALPVGYTFTQQDIADGNIKFVSQSGGHFTTDFKFTVKDGDRRLLPNQRDGGIYDSSAIDAPLSIHTFNIHYDEIVTSGGGGGPGSGGTFPGFANPNTGGTLAITPIEIAEGQLITITPTHLNATDTDNTADQLTYRLLSLPENGRIFLNGSPLSLLGSFTQDDVNSGRVSFQHDGKEDFHSTFTFDVSDGQSKTAITTFTIDVKPQNDTPTASTDHEIKLNEGASKVITTQNINLADADNATPTDATTGYATDNVLSFQVTARPTHGKLQLDGVDIALNAIISQADLSAGKLRYVHDASEFFADQFTIVPLDNQGVSGPDGSNPTNQTSTGAPLVIPVVIYPINDAPAYQHKSQLIAGEAGAIAEGSTASIGGALSYANTNGITGAGAPTLPNNSVAHLVYGDDDNSTEQRQYRVTTAPSNGTLLLNGAALSTGSIFTQADLDAGRISYRHNGTETSTDFFDYLVSDGDFIANDSTSTTQGSSPPAASRYNIEILSSNDKPTVTASAANLDVTASGSNYVNVPAINVADLDLDVLTSGETDFLRVEVSLLDSSNTLITGAKIKYSAADPVAPGSGTDRHFVSGKDSNSLVIQGTKAEVSAILASLQVANSADRDSSSDKLHIVVDDRLYNNTGSLDSGANGGVTNQDGTPIDATNNRASTDITLLTSNSNDIPTISNPSSYSVNEDALLTLSGFSLSDADSFDKNVTVTVSLYNDAGRTTLATASEGTLTYSGLSNVTASGTGSNTITLTGTMANVQTALNSLKFDNAPDFNGTGVDTGNLYLRTTFTDFGHADVPAGNSVSVDNIINIVPVNDAPVLTVPGSAFVMASGTSVAIPGISFQDTKDTAQGALDNFYTVTIVAPTVGDTLAATVSGAATSSYDSGTRTLTITGSRADVNATLANLSYAPANANADATYTLNVTVNDKDSGGIGNGKEVTGVDGNNTASNTVRVFVSGINDPAQIIATNITVNEGSATLNLTNAVGAFSVNDSDDNGATNLSATVTVSQGVISAVGGSGGTISGTGSNTITITGASEAQINARLQALTVTFPDESGIPAATDWNGNFNVTVTVNDNGNTGQRPSSLTGDTGDATGNPGDYAYVDGSSAALLTTRTISVTVNPVNDAPIRTDANPVILPAVLEDVSGGVGNTPPGDTVSNLFAGKFNDARDGITNGSSPNNFAGIAITANSAIAAQGAWQYSSDGNTWTALPTVSTSSALLLKATDSLRFVPQPNFHGTPGGLSVRLVDDSSGALTTGGTANVSNDSSLSGGTTRYSNSSNAVTLNTSVSNVNDRPTASNTTLTATTEDHNNPPGASISSLGFGYSDVTDNRLSISGGGNAASTFGGIAIVGNLANSTTQGVWQYHTGSGWVDIGSSGSAPSDSAALILPTTAQLRFLPNVANFNGTPGNLVIRVADSSQAFNAASNISGNLTQTDIWSQTVTLGTQVSKQNDAPTLTHTASNPTAAENGLTGSATSIDPVNLLSAGSVADLDLASTAGLNTNTFGAGQITISLSDGIAGDILQINGALPSGVTSSGGTGNTPLVINLDNDTSLSEVESILTAIQYKNTSDNPTVFNTDTTRNYSVVVTDGNNLQSGGNAGGPTALSAATINGTISLIATNDPPVAIDMTNTAPIPASAGPTSIDLLTGTDVDGTIASITITSLPDPAQGRLFMADGVTAVTLNQVLTPTEAANLKFDPSGSYAGISTFTFTVTDNEGAVDATPATATITITNTPPVASDDNDFGTLGQPVTLNVLANDTDTENNLDPTSVKIVGANNPDGSLVVAGEGTWSVNPTTGAITFTPLPGFINDPTPISYTVKDLTGASSNAATVIVDYPPFKPVAVDDRETGTSGQPVVINVVGNDVDPQHSLDPTTVKIVGTSNQGDPLVVSGEGTWTVNPTTGAITFTPETGFTGDPTPISYTVVDNNTGAPSNPASVTVDYPQTPPVAVNDHATGLTGQTVTQNVLDNDSDPENDLDPTSVQIVGTSNPGDMLIVPGQGEWSINPTTGAIRFTPILGFTADPTPIQYTVKDRTGLLSDPATVSIDYPQTTPLAINDSKVGISGQAVTIDVINNDSDQENDLDPSTVKIVGTLNPGDPLFVPNEGTWTVNPNSTGAITFTPLPGFTTDPTPISYTVKDRTGISSNPATVEVNYPQTPPTAVNDSVRGINGQPATIDVIANDSDPENDLDPASVQIVGTSNPGDPLVVTGEGTWSVDPTSGAITFTPETGFIADPTPISYTVKDRTGLSSNPATVSVDYPPYAPETNYDSKEGVIGQPVIIDVLANDTDLENNIDPTTVQLVGSPNPGDPLIVAGEGTWSVNPVNGNITFTPETGFSGEPTPIQYTVKDQTGQTSNASTVGIDYPPETVNDTANGISGQPVKIAVLGNDSDPDHDIDPTSVKIVGTNNPGEPLVVAGQGTWSVNPTTGEITFTPTPGFTADPTPISYTVKDLTGLSSNPATVTIDYPQNPPLTGGDYKVGVSGQAVTIDVLSNDSDPENDIDPTTVKIVGTANPGDPLVVPGEGVWTVNPTTGAITFTPEAGFTLDPTPIGYSVKDQTGLSSNTVTVTVDYPQTAPTAVNDSKSGSTGQPVVINVLSNDRDPENDLDPSTVQIIGTTNPGDSLFVAGQGSWSINSNTGAITFTPIAGFIGDPTPIRYTVTDRTGLISNPATVTVNYPDFIPIPPDNLWNAGNGFIKPLNPIDLPTIDTTIPEVLPVIDTITGGFDLNGTTDIGKPYTNPIRQMLDRLNNLQFRIDRLGLFALNRYQDVDLPISREVDRIEHLRQFDDIFQRISSHGRTSWHLGGLRHSVTLHPKEVGDNSLDFLSVHTKVVGNLLYVEFEHTVNQQAIYDIDHVHARLSDGRPLPEWLSFDQQNGLLSGIPPAGGEIIELQFSTKLQDGRLLSSAVEIEPDTGRLIKLEEPDQAVGHSRFTDQVKQSADRFNVEKNALRRALKP